jgi:hypothetical protein
MDTSPLGYVLEKVGVLLAAETIRLFFSYRNNGRHRLFPDNPENITSQRLHKQKDRQRPIECFFYDCSSLVLIASATALCVQFISWRYD